MSLNGPTVVANVKKPRRNRELVLRASVSNCARENMWSGNGLTNKLRGKASNRERGNALRKKMAMFR